MQKRADVPDGWPFIPPYDPTTYPPLESDRPPLHSRVLATMRETAALMPAGIVGLLLIVVLATGGTR